MADNHTFSPVNWGGQDPVGPSSAHHQAEAGSGMHASLSAQRWAARRGQVQAAPPQQLRSPIGNEAQAFAVEWAQDNAPHVSVARSAVVGAILGAAIAHYARRGR